MTVMNVMNVMNAVVTYAKSDGSFLKVMDDLCLDFLWSSDM